MGAWNRAWCTIVAGTVLASAGSSPAPAYDNPNCWDMEGPEGCCSWHDLRTRCPNGSYCQPNLVSNPDVWWLNADDIWLDTSFGTASVQCAYYAGICDPTSPTGCRYATTLSYAACITSTWAISTTPCTDQ